MDRTTPARRRRTTRDYALLALLPLIAIAGCNYAGTDNGKGAATSQAAAPAATADPLAAHDEQSDQPYSDAEARPVMQAQVVLDRLGFTPGVVDGKDGMSTRNAVSGFQEANGLTVTGKVDEATTAALAKWKTIPATRVVTIPDAFAAGPFYAVPADAADQAKMPALGYASLDEKLAERFHTTVAVLKALNPGGVPAGLETTAPASAPAESAAATTEVAPDAAAATAAAFPQPGPPSFFRAGQQIRVPNVGGDAVDVAAGADAEWVGTLVMLGVGSNQPKVDKIVVSKSKSTLKGFDKAGKLVAVYTATMGSQYDPLPLGTWKVNGSDRNPKFNYNPKLFWDAKPGDKKALLPPGPNGPVGVVWIDLSKEHYGIHGTPHPETIGRAESHGCVRLTNWDVARLAQMVSPGTVVVFEA